MSDSSIDTVAVLGLGTMGHGIAQTFAVAGCRVRCYQESGRGIYEYTPKTVDAKREQRDRQFLALAKLLYADTPLD